jgi:Subunit 21 of Mediator complex
LLNPTYLHCDWQLEYAHRTYSILFTGNQSKQQQLTQTANHLTTLTILYKTTSPKEPNLRKSHTVVILEFLDKSWALFGLGLSLTNMTLVWIGSYSFIFSGLELGLGKNPPSSRPHTLYCSQVLSSLFRLNYLQKQEMDIISQLQDQVNMIALLAVNTFGTLQRDAPPVRLSTDYPEPASNTNPSNANPNTDGNPNANANGSTNPNPNPSEEANNMAEQPKAMSAALVQAAKKVDAK